MRLLKLTALIFASCTLWMSSIYAHTVKSVVDGAQLWSAPDPNTSTRSIGTLGTLEEVEVLQTITDRHRRTWYKVRSSNSPGWKRRDIVAWVKAKDFRTVTADTETFTEAVSIAGCTKCLRAQHGYKKVGVESIPQKAISNLAVRMRNSFIWPASGPIRSGFGMRRHPILGTLKLHDGIDIAAGNRSPVRAPKAGTILVSKNGCSDANKSCNGGAGNTVIVDHGDGTRTKYLHLSRSCPLPRSGSFVEQGDQIACIGSSGASTGPHLHFSTFIDGILVNPLQVLPRSNL